MFKKNKKLTLSQELKNETKIYQIELYDKWEVKEYQIGKVKANKCYVKIQYKWTKAYYLISIRKASIQNGYVYNLFLDKKTAEQYAKLLNTEEGDEYEKKPYWKRRVKTFYTN